MYNPQSTIATEFIDDQEIRDSLAYAQENKSNYELINSLIRAHVGHDDVGACP